MINKYNARVYFSTIGIVILVGAMSFKFGLKVTFPVIIMMFGSIFNFIAIYSNNGFMPVHNPLVNLAEKNNIHGVHKFYKSEKEIKYYYFCDVISFTFGKTGLMLSISIGDLLISLGILVQILFTIFVFAFL